ncbi:DUF4129 domain-containing protein [Chitinophaga sp. GCM10012297]|uniref:DUF4129 domain-containing protein n=1 Tax=Chitinophaga chungangae TaxID=2821488 RepID=A0ABS3YEJ9_9BACT|nr:DUF4129 domain-containing protein [Chitinophaga chungangae]MBO9153088.1 DUF4129 domain-containing protein [Chitinophaga chungangae]
MKRWKYLILPALFCLSLHAAAQDQKEKNKDFDEMEWRVLDSTEEDSDEEANPEEVFADSVLTAEVDTTPFTDETAAEDSEETEDHRSVEHKIRSGAIPYSRWDNQRLGDWSESGQVRLTIRKPAAGDLAELREMSALNYDKDENPVKASGSSPWLRSLGAWVRANRSALLWSFYISLGALLVMVLVLFIRKNDISFRWSSGSRRYGDFNTVAEEGPLNYEALAASAAAEGRLRDAVRFRYLHTLQLLEARQLIAPGKDKTNMDFLRELSRTAFHKPFAALTLHYEYIWYGKLPLSNGQFSHLDDQFAAFTQSIKQYP